MDPKFVKLDEAAEQLGITIDHLNALREQGKLRAYRDGSSWKFRTEEIDGMASDGVPELDPEDSGINLDFSSLSLGGDKGLDEPAVADEDDLLDLDLASEDDDDAGFSKIDIEDDDDLDLDLSAGSSADLAIDLDDEEEIPALADDEELSLSDDTAVEDMPVSATAGGSDLDLELDIESGDDPESILLSEAELGDSDASPSTIIGRAELDDALDLELASDEPKSNPAMSDVRLADLDDLDLDAGATGELPASGEALVDFDDVEDLGIDLEAESSRILRPEDVAAAQAAAGAQAQQKAPEMSDLDLDIDEDYGLAASSSMALGGGASAIGGDDDEIIISGSEIDLGGESKVSGSGLTGLSALELDNDDDEDDFVLGDGSDLTLSSADSGINLSPADSGLSLDDAALDLAGSAMASGIDFGDAAGLVADEPGGDFELTPLGEDLGADDEDDSSQVIALDAFEEQEEADDLLGGGGLGGAAMPAAAFGQPTMVARAETQFTAWQVVFLTLCLILLSLCGIMAIDVLRSMWSWGEPYAVNSSLIDSLSGFLFP
jgi:excisionase family DNA binding protein